MREYRFRAWDYQKKIMRDWEWIRERLGLPNIIEYSNPAIFVPMQYTERKDKNNKKIHEGDIVRYEGVIGCISIKLFDNSPFWMLLNDGKHYKNSHISIGVWSKGDVEVIGNIYENSKLLKAYNIEDIK